MDEKEACLTPIPNVDSPKAAVEKHWASMASNYIRDQLHNFILPLRPLSL